MCSKQILFVLGVTLSLHLAAAWWCESSADCAVLGGSSCVAGACACPGGSQPALGGTVCADVAPYFTSKCVEDFQCSRLFTGYACVKPEGSIEGTCGCRPNHHFYRGRCWESLPLGAPCARSEQCQGVLLDPYSMSCEEVCVCSEGYYLRQRGECRKAGTAVDEPCVVDVDCRFENGVCDQTTFKCQDSTQKNSTVSEQPESIIEESKPEAEARKSKMAVRQHGVSCSSTNGCESPFECTSLGYCFCPPGYYSNDDGTDCLAHLGSPATQETCTGILTVLEDGVCKCRPNFYFEENMKDCAKASIRFTDFCLNDQMCHTFGGAARCGAPTPPWGLRQCECDEELAVYDERLNVCRVAAGIGETCEVDSDCLAGNVEILCAANDDGERRCECPAGLTPAGGLCLAAGLELGDTCQVDGECEGDNTVCDGVCSCGDGYQENEGVCAPEIGGVCLEDSDCVVDDTVCAAGDTGAGAATCQCREGTVQDGARCWPVAPSYNSTCVATAQCVPTLGVGSRCEGGACVCDETHHYRDDVCQVRRGLFEPCARSGECFVPGVQEFVECRNALCQCTFEHPYNEQQQTCRSKAVTVLGNILLIITVLGAMLQS
ncbi:hypothetical protein JYU34_008218 [Plutella xylostella]|uniref:EB domain-containing protein n=1 Tax=Plutella xylostella TaxID=51655 RepID=A0ABQ7QP02_PLUXY|nr:hypothetical protein JYU34_008218 [Plutella xylostella]